MLRPLFGFYVLGFMFRVSGFIFRVLVESSGLGDPARDNRLRALRETTGYEPAVLAHAPLNAMVVSAFGFRF